MSGGMLQQRARLVENRVLHAGKFAAHEQGVYRDMHVVPSSRAPPPPGPSPSG